MRPDIIDVLDSLEECKSLFKHREDDEERPGTGRDDVKDQLSVEHEPRHPRFKIKTCSGTQTESKGLNPPLPPSPPPPPPRPQEPPTTFSAEGLKDLELSPKKGEEKRILSRGLSVTAHELEEQKSKLKPVAEDDKDLAKNDGLDLENVLKMIPGNSPVLHSYQ